jgi:integrase
MGRKKKEYGLVWHNEKWAVQFSFEGKRPKASTGTTDKKLAERQAKATMEKYIERSRDKAVAVRDQLNKTDQNTASPDTVQRIRLTRDSKLSDLIAHFCEGGGLNRREKTIKHLRSALRSLKKYVGDLKVSDITPLDIEQWHKHYLTDYQTKHQLEHKPDSTYGIRNYHGTIQARFQTLVDSRVLKDNPFTTATNNGGRHRIKPMAPPRDNVRQKGWSKAEIKLILDTADRMANYKDTEHANRKQSTVMPLMPMFIRLALATGCRTNELCSAKYSDIRIDDNNKKYLHIEWSGAKGKKNRKVYLSQSALEAIKNIDKWYEYLRYHDDHDPFVHNAKMMFPDDGTTTAVAKYYKHLFPAMTDEAIQRRISPVDPTYLFEHGRTGQRFTVDNVSKNFIKIVVACGLREYEEDGTTLVKTDKAKKYTIYETRHTWAVQAFDNNVPLNEMKANLGHSDIKLVALYGESDGGDNDDTFDIGV